MADWIDGGELMAGNPLAFEQARRDGFALRYRVPRPAGRDPEVFVEAHRDGTRIGVARVVVEDQTLAVLVDPEAPGRRSSWR